MAKINLLQETMEILDDYRKDFYKDVLWIGTSDGLYSCTHEEFLVLANVEYNNGYGGAEICTNLVLVGHDWWLSRGEYDGSEWWQYNEKPAEDENVQKLPSIWERI